MLVVQGLGIRVQGPGFGVSGSRFGASDCGFGIQASELRVESVDRAPTPQREPASPFRLHCSGFRASG